jgi:hypothetical protein
VYPINAKVGNVAPGQAQIILNSPFTIWKGIYKWVSTYVMDEKNAEWVSKRIQYDLDALDLTTAITFDWDDKGLYLLCLGKKIWVFNYRVNKNSDTPGAWYILDLPHEPTCFISIEGELYFGTTAGQIMRFDEDLRTYDGATITATWEMGFTSFGSEWLRKFIQKMYESIKPEANAYLETTYQTDVSSYSDTYTAYYNLATFKHANFAHFSFHTNYNPQPFKFKIRAKKIDYFKLILVSDTTGTCTVLTITLPVRTGGEVKGR